MYKSIKWLMFSMLIAPLSFAEDYVTTGEAYDIDDPEKLLYREQYTPVDDNKRAYVHYFSSEDERIAEKTLDYGPGKTKPSYVLTDSRNDSLWSVEWDGDSHLLLKSGAQDGPKSKRISAEQVQVVDAGFDAFIQQQWDALLEGERVTFYFAFPNRLANVRLRAEKIDIDDSPIRSKESDWVYFKVQINSRVLSLFVADLQLAYDPENKQIMVFRGRSNLPDAEGKAIDVEIYYEYHE